MSFGLFYLFSFGLVFNRSTSIRWMTYCVSESILSTINTDKYKAWVRLQIIHNIGKARRPVHGKYLVTNLGSKLCCIDCQQQRGSEKTVSYEIVRLCSHWSFPLHRSERRDLNTFFLVSVPVSRQSLTWRVHEIHVHLISEWRISTRSGPWSCPRSHENVYTSVPTPRMPKEVW